MGVEMTAPAWETVEAAAIPRTTVKAVLVTLPDGAPLWIPRSVIRGGAELEETAEPVALAVQQWFCRRELAEPRAPEGLDEVPF